MSCGLSSPTCSADSVFGHYSRICGTCRCGLVHHTLLDEPCPILYLFPCLGVLCLCTGAPTDLRIGIALKNGEVVSASNQNQENIKIWDIKLVVT